MNVDIKVVKSGTIEEFAEAHHMTMDVIERELPEGSPMRYYAKFARCEVKNRGCLEGRFGNGSTPEEAIKSYATEISMQDLVFNAYTENRKEIKCWRLTGEPDKIIPKPVCLTQFASKDFGSFKDMAEYYESLKYVDDNLTIEDVIKDTQHLIRTIQKRFSKGEPMTGPHSIASFKLPIALSVPHNEIERIRKAINKEITGSDEPINIQLDDGSLIENPKFSQHRERLKQAHWNLCASHSKELEVTVYSDGSLEIA